jgi:hypothetical protein
VPISASEANDDGSAPPLPLPPATVEADAAAPARPDTGASSGELLRREERRVATPVRAGGEPCPARLAARAAVDDAETDEGAGAPDSILTARWLSVGRDGCISCTAGWPCCCDRCCCCCWCAWSCCWFCWFCCCWFCAAASSDFERECCCDTTAAICPAGVSSSMGMPSIPRSRRISSRCVDTSASRALSSSRSRSHSRRSRSELAAFSRSSASSRLRFSRCAREYAALSYLWRKQQQEKKEKKKEDVDTRW